MKNVNGLDCRKRIDGWWKMLTYSSIDVAFCRTKCNRLAVIYEDYYFHHNRRYKDGHYWCCAHRSCKVRLISNGQLAFSRRNNRLEHQHPPNAPNLIDKEFRSQLLQQLARQPNSSVRHIYDHIYQSAIDRGYFSFFNVNQSSIGNKSQCGFSPYVIV